MATKSSYMRLALPLWLFCGISFVAGIAIAANTILTLITLPNASALLAAAALCMLIPAVSIWWFRLAVRGQLERQDALADLHQKAVQTAMLAAQEVQALSEAQRAQQTSMEAFVNAAGPTMEGLEQQATRWGALETRRIEALEQCLSTLAQGTNGVLTALLSSAERADEITAQMGRATQRLDAGTANFSAAITRNTAHMTLTNAQAAQAGKDAAAMLEQFNALMAGGRSAFISGLKVLVEGKASMAKATGTITSAAAHLHNETDAFKASAEEQVASAVSAIREDVRAMFENSAQDLEQASKAHAATIAREVAALSGYSDVLGDARQAANALTSTATDIQARAKEAYTALDQHLQSQRDVLAPLHDMAGPLTASMEALAALEGGRVDTALMTLEQVTLALTTAKDTQTTPQFKVLEAQLKTLEDVLVSQMLQGERNIAASVTALGAQSGQFHATLKTGLDAVGQIHLENAGTQAGANKDLRGQLRKLSDQLSAQKHDLQADIKYLRANQLQSLKHTIRALPTAVAGQLEPALAKDAQRLQDTLEVLVADALAQQQSRLNAGPPLLEIDQPALDLGERLALALADMSAIEEDVTALATAALAVPSSARDAQAFQHTILNAEQALSTWGGKLENVATAIAIARDAA